MSAAYSAMIGQSLTMVVSPRGTVQKIEGMSRLMERVLNAQPQDRIAPDVLDGFRNTFSDDTTRDMLGWGTAPFPDRPLHPGDTWEDHLSATVPMRFSAASVFASRSKRAMRSGSDTSETGNTLTATCRPRFVSVAL
jgi:hypothetical protein